MSAKKHQAVKQLAWKRATTRETSLAKIWRWESQCGQYCVERHKYSIGQNAPRKKRMKDKYFAMQMTDLGWRFMRIPPDEYGTREEAEAECNKHASGIRCGRITESEGKLTCSCGEVLRRRKGTHDRRWMLNQRQFRSKHRKR